MYRVVEVVQVLVVQLRPIPSRTIYAVPNTWKVTKGEWDRHLSKWPKKWFTPRHNSINVMKFGTLRNTHWKQCFRTYLNQHQWELVRYLPSWFPSHPHNVITVECKAMHAWFTRAPYLDAYHMVPVLIAARSSIFCTVSFQILINAHVMHAEDTKGINRTFIWCINISSQFTAGLNLKNAINFLICTVNKFQCT